MAGAPPRTAAARCCVCGATHSTLWCTAIDRLHDVPGTFTYTRCAACGVVYQNPQVIPDDIPSLYPETYAPWTRDTAGTKPPAAWKRRLRDTLLITGLPGAVREVLDGGGALLDAGCGDGKFLARIASEHPRAEVAGLDFSPRAVEAVRDKLGVTAHCGTLPEVAEQSPEPAFDVVTMWWYLEHVPDPAAVIAAARKLLRPGGWIAIAVPNVRSLNAALFRARWFHLDCPRHLWLFTPASLRRLVTAAGFDVRLIRHDTSPWGLLGSLEYSVRGRISDIDSATLSKPLLKAAARPVSLATALLRQADTIALYARAV
jgi:SAM-dependent methyltransferase